MEQFLFDSVEESQRLQQQQSRAATTTMMNSSIGDPSVCVELRFAGLPNRPAGTHVRVAGTLFLEQDGLPCGREDLEQLVRTKLFEVNCPASSGISFDITTTEDGWLVDEAMFIKTRDSYISGKLKGSWKVDATILQNVAVETFGGTLRTTQQQQQQQQQSSFTAAALQQHQRNLQLGLLSSSHSSSDSTLSPIDLNAQRQQTHTVRQVSIAALRCVGLSEFQQRGSWALLGTVVSIQQKNEKITDMVLCQPDCTTGGNPLRDMITVVCFDAEVSKRLRATIFPYCEVLLERAALAAKNDQDKRFSRDDHPLKIQVDKMATVTVTRTAAENEAHTAMIRAATVINRSGGVMAAAAVVPALQTAAVARSGGSGIPGFGGMAMMTAASSSSNSGSGGSGGGYQHQHHHHYHAMAMNGGNAVIGFQTPDMRSLGMDQAVRAVGAASTVMSGGAPYYPPSHGGGGGSGAMSLSSMPSYASGQFSHQQQLYLQQQQQQAMSSAPPSQPGARVVTRTRFSDLQRQKSDTPAAPPATGAVLAGAPCPTRKDVESRDSVVRQHTAQREMQHEAERKVSAADGTRKELLQPDCFLCGVDGSSEDSVEALKQRLSKVFDKVQMRLLDMEAAEKSKNNGNDADDDHHHLVGSVSVAEAASSAEVLKARREAFMPTMADVQRLLSDGREAVRAEILKKSNGKASQKVWCTKRVVDPLTGKRHRVHPRCAHLCTDYQSQAASGMCLGDCTPRLERRICDLCGEEGAIAKCYDPTCSRWYHSTCAVFSKGWIDFGQYDPERPCPSCPSHAYMAGKENALKTDGGKKKKKTKNNKDRRRKRGGSDDDDDEDNDDDCLFDAREVEHGDLRDPDDDE